MRSKEIKELRLKLGLTQSQLAQKVGVTLSSVIRWENSKQSPSPLAEKALKSLLDES